MKKSKVTNIRPAGANHQVVTVQGGDSAYCRKPCETCPWRVDAVGEFPAEAFRHSAHTAYDMSGEMFACHSCGAGTPATCAGFLLNGAGNNMAFRVAVIQGKIDMREVSDGGHELHKNYRAMAEANGVDEDDPVLRRCRD